MLGGFEHPFVVVLRVLIECPNYQPLSLFFDFHRRILAVLEMSLIEGRVHRVALTSGVN